MTQTDPNLPSVLVVLVARNGERWLRDCLQALSQQEYPRMGVVGVDCGSRDGSRQLLTRALGEDRVLTSEVSLGSVLEAVCRREGATDVDYLLVLHDDTALEKDAVLRLVEAAVTSEPAGVVGAKLVDWDDPRILMDIGWSADRFGHPYSPLEPGELDQGQHDRIQEVLFVSSAAMLISQQALVRAGVPDNRLGMEDPELDFCWRMRLAGYHVLVNPLAVARHRDAGWRGERRGDRSARHRRYYEERVAGVSIFKNYGLSSVWVIPLALALGLIKIVALMLMRRFGETGQILAAWGWNTIRFPGTVLRRVKIQPARKVRDREIHRYMAHGSVRLRRLIDAAGRLVSGDLEVPEYDEDGVPTESLTRRASTAARGHPVAAAWVIAIVLAALAYRPVLGATELTGGWLPSVLPTAADFLRELGSGFRTTALGGAQWASPALAAWGGAGSVPFVSIQLVEKALLCVLPLAAAVTAYKACMKLTGHSLASLLGAAGYALSALVLWSFSNGRIPTLVVLAVLPKLLERFEIAFAPPGPGNKMRFMVGTGIFLAIGAAFVPGIVLGAGLVLMAYVLVPPKARRLPAGLSLSIGTLIAGTALAFPLLVDPAASGGAQLASMIGVADIETLSRLVLVPGTAGGPVAWFLPLAAALGLMLAGAASRRAAFRLFLIAVAGIGLSWAAAAGWLPQALSNPGVYLATAAIACAGLAAIGMESAFAMERGFGLRRVTAWLMMAVLFGGLVLQGGLVALGFWDIGTGKLPAAWPLIEQGAPGEFRVLWLGSDDGRPFPAPGGDPIGVFEAGEASARYSITERTGTTLLDIGRSSRGSGYDYLESSLSDILGGSGVHGGALLGPLGVRFIVAEDDDIPRRLQDALERQVDLDRVPAGGLVIYRNASAWPESAVVVGEDVSDVLESGDPQRVVSARAAEEVVPLTPVEGGWDGSGEGAAWVAEQFAPGWRLRAGPATVRPSETLGWALSFRSPGGDFQIRYEDQQQHTMQLWLLAALWAVALWVTRKPVRR